MIDKVKYYINKIGLTQHPEGGYYKEVYRSEEMILARNLPERYKGDRNFSTSIYFLLEGKQKSDFHKLQSDEIWHFYDGSPVRIYILKEGILNEMIIGSNFDKGEAYQGVIKKDSWFAVEVVDEESFSLVGCIVAPGFDFQDFELGIRDELLNEYPQHKGIILKFTR